MSHLKEQSRDRNQDRTNEAASTSDRIERTIEIASPRSKVWHALTDAREFNAWFGVNLEGEFKPGARVRGNFRHAKYQHVVCDILIERMEPEHTFVWRWHPYAVEPGVDYAAEVPTLVTFTLSDIAGGTRLTVVESGFDKVPLERRALAYQMNNDGWASQMKALERYVT